MMIKVNKKNRIYILLALRVALLAQLLRWGGKVVLWGRWVLFLQLSSVFLYATLFLAWGESVRQRVIDPLVRQHLIAIAGLCTFWTYIRIVKYCITYQPILNTCLW